MTYCVSPGTSKRSPLAHSSPVHIAAQDPDISRLDDVCPSLDDRRPRGISLTLSVPPTYGQRRIQGLYDEGIMTEGLGLRGAP